MNSYVVGFVFDKSGSNVVLIRKSKPKWQAGMLNGVGGKIEDAEDRNVQAMVREFREEAGVDTEEKDWTPFHLAMYRDASGLPTVNVYFFKMFSDEVYAEAYTAEREEIEKVPVSHVICDPATCLPVPNLRWLLLLALDSYVSKSYTTDWNGTAILPLKRPKVTQNRQDVRANA